MKEDPVTEYLTSETVEQVSTCEILEYPLPHRPDMKARVKQLPVGVMKRIGKQIQKGGDAAETAQRELIEKSIVNSDGSPVYTKENVALLKEGNTPLYASLIVVISKANKRTDEDDEAELDTLEKNSEATA